MRPVSIAFLTSLFLPPAAFVVFSTSSMSAGLIVCAFAWCFVGLAGRVPPIGLEKSDAFRVMALFAGLLLLTLHVLISNLITGGVDFQRYFLSCLILVVVLIGAHFAARKLARIPPRHLIQATSFGLLFLTAIGLAAALGVPAIGPQASGKAIVIFSEPSHYSLAILPLLLFRISVAKRLGQVQLICLALVLALVLQSLTMIVGILIIAMLLLRPMPLILLLAFAAAGSLALDMTYYISRLMFSSETTNLSTLVFMQGWDNAIVNFKETAGIGVGFQQFGVAGSTGQVAETISAMLGEPLSLRDGGSTATKLVGEFGAFGILVLAIFIKAVARAGLYIRRSQLQPVYARNARQLFFCSLTFTYVIEMFIRGTGYFSPGGFLAVVGLIALSNQVEVRLPRLAKLYPRPDGMVS